jgi:EAL domain-containing protein (putative c-di-GMP-specific phosphodiesterase class I)
VENGLDAHNVVFEIAKTAALANGAGAHLLARTLNAMGCELALDFGTGFGAFSYLMEFPVRYLKIDGSLVRDARRDEDDRAIIGSICCVPGEGNDCGRRRRSARRSRF